MWHAWPKISGHITDIHACMYFGLNMSKLSSLFFHRFFLHWWYHELKFDLYSLLNRLLHWIYVVFLGFGEKCHLDHYSTSFTQNVVLFTNKLSPIADWLSQWGMYVMWPASTKSRSLGLHLNYRRSLIGYHNGACMSCDLPAPNLGHRGYIWSMLFWHCIKLILI